MSAKVPKEMYLKPDQVAFRLGITTDKVKQLAEDGKLPYLPLREGVTKKFYKFPLKGVREFERAQKGGTPSNGHGKQDTAELMPVNEAFEKLLIQWSRELRKVVAAVEVLSTRIDTLTGLWEPREPHE